MKKISTLLAAFLLCMGMAHAQDIYFAGNSNGSGKIWKNNTLVYSISDSTMVNLMAMQVTPDGNIFSAGFVFDSVFNTQGRVWLNDSMIFNAGTNTIVNDLALGGDEWTAVGLGENEWENVSGFVWQNGVLLHTFNDSITDNQIVTLAIDPATGNIYSGGRSNNHATVWKNGTILWQFDQLSEVNDILFDGENLYAAGVDYSETIRATLWQNDSIIFSINGENTESEFTAMAFFDGSLYLSGNIDSALYIWRDGEILYSQETTQFSEITALVVNEFGVYYAGQLDGTATVWKDGEVLYEIEDCDAISALAVLPSDEPLFTLTVEADSAAWGSVTGGGIYHYGDTATIEAIPNMGCEFLFWNDSITDNPRNIIITQDTSFVAHFNPFEYTIAASVSPENAGIVTGGGTYHYGDTIMLEAIPNEGFRFKRWNDDNTDNPRTVVVTQDNLYIAMFDLSHYSITVVSDHPTWGTVTGGGIFNYGDTIQIAATANLGFEFVNWTDGNADNPRDIVVTGDATYTAHFNIQQCEIRAIVTPEGAGTVNGAGIYNYGETIHLTVHSNPGYVFDMWDDGNITNPRTVFVEGDAAYTAIFNTVQYEITTEAEPEEGGTVRGAGVYDYGATATLKADPNEGYTFICWQDGIVTNPRNVPVTQNAHYKAKFYYTGTPQYTVTVVANNPELGTVTGSGTYPEGDSIQISAIPISGAIFTSWDDGNTDNPRTVVVTSDLEFKAIFSVTETFTITVRPENPFVGSTFGSGTYPGGSTVNIGATPNQGFYFSGWQDGDMNNPRTITVTDDAEYVAYFSQEPTLTYTVTVYYDENQGFVLGAGTYAAGATATLVAIPADGYMFVKWGDGVTDNQREIVMNQDVILAVFFDQTGIEDGDLKTLSLYPNPAQEQIRIEGLEGESKIEIYNAMGQLVKAVQLNGDETIGIGDLNAGIYLMRINEKHKLRFVKE